MTFMCPFIIIPPCILFAYRYDVSQVAKIPVLAEWYEQNRVALEWDTAQPGPRPILHGPLHRSKQGGRRVKILTSPYREEGKALTTTQEGTGRMLLTSYLEGEKYRGKLEKPIHIYEPRSHMGLERGVSSVSRTPTSVFVCVSTVGELPVFPRTGNKWQHAVQNRLLNRNTHLARLSEHSLLSSPRSSCLPAMLSSLTGRIVSRRYCLHPSPVSSSPSALDMQRSFPIVAAVVLVPVYLDRFFPSIH